ncbi:tyrosine-type recombinase/integrase, partial [Aestuariicoccus sp. MJ-SS9]|uniref:tyrosine-type recombinase/integrase n=1 Tax=Aestuariicoccus sp. MJ-SS9 TaxID=3079855 RepID=UPI0029153D70
TWLYRRNYPADVALALGVQALKQSLKTGDASTARQRAAEVNVLYESTITQVRERAEEVLSNNSGPDWATPSPTALDHLRHTLARSGDLETLKFQKPVPRSVPTVAEAARDYLNLRSDQLRPGGFKSVRYSVGLFASEYGDLRLDQLDRPHGRAFLTAIAQLSPLLGKSERTRNLSLKASLAQSRGERITVRTQKRIWSQVRHFLSWTVCEGHLDQHPFEAVRFDGKLRPAPYAVPTDPEVVRFLQSRDPLQTVTLMCLLTGMRSGEATGLLREDVVTKGNLGSFIHVRPNRLRLLKTDAAERLVPVHPVLDERLRDLPSEGPLFPNVKVNDVTKAFARHRRRVDLDRPGLVFHSTRKWFITQCERTGVPEHWTASLVGHQSARSENGITYGIYSAGISDEQKRGIVDQIRLP